MAELVLGFLLLLPYRTGVGGNRCLQHLKGRGKGLTKIHSYMDISLDKKNCSLQAGDVVLHGRSGSSYSTVAAKQVALRNDPLSMDDPH